MLSRVADSIYWMNRYIERAENVARFVDVNLTLSLELPSDEGQWAPLVQAAGAEDLYRARYGEPTKDSVLQFLTFDTENPDSILSCLRAARENARSVREIISSEMWAEINRSYLDVREAAGDGLARISPHEFFQRVKEDSHLFAGIAGATMSHGEAWHFGRLGRFLERAGQTARMVDVKYFILLPSPRDVGSPLDDLQWSAVLRSASALEMYRKKRRRRITPGDVADFLVLDREFPRSVRFCVTLAEQSLHEITGTPRGTFGSEAEKVLGRLRSELDFVDAEDLFRVGLHEFLVEMIAKLNDCGEAVRRTFFAPREARPVPGAPQ